MKLALASILVFGLIANASATEFLGKRNFQHSFTDKEVTITTTNIFTFYDYGEPTVRSHESVDEIMFTGKKAKSIFNELKSFYKAKKIGKGYIAVLDTNYHVVAKDMIIIECLDQTNCSLRYDQKKKDDLIKASSYPKYQAGIIGDITNHRGIRTIEEGLMDIIRLQERGSMRSNVLFSNKSPNKQVKIGFSLGSVAPLMRDAGICEEFSRPGCGIYCRGSRNTNRDTKFAGNCIFNLELTKSTQK